MHKKDCCENCGVKKSASEDRDENEFLIRRRINSDHALTVHHVDHNHFNNELTNLQTLCRTCHTEVHRNESGQQAAQTPIEEEREGNR